MSKESVKKFIMDAQEKSELKSIFEKTKSGFDSKEAKRSLSDDDLGNVAGGSWLGKIIKVGGNILGDIL